MLMYFSFVFNSLNQLWSFTFQVLSDDKKRALYDQYGEAGVKSSVGAQAGAYTVGILISF